MSCILIVEDEGLFAMELTWAIEDAGYVVVGPEKSVAATISTLARFKVDLALLDIGLNGETVFPVAKTLGATGVPFIFITGHTSAALPSEYVGRPLLQKPCQTPAVIALIRRTLGETLPQMPP